MPGAIRKIRHEGCANPAEGEVPLLGCVVEVTRHGAERHAPDPGTRAPDGHRGRNAARRRDARTYLRLPLRVNLAILPVAVLVGGVVNGGRGAVGGAMGVGLALLIFGGGAASAAFAGRGTGARLLLVTLAGLLIRLLAAGAILWAMVRAGVADGPSIAVAAMLAVVGTHIACIWASERTRRATSRVDQNQVEH